MKTLSGQIPSAHWFFFGSVYCNVLPDFFLKMSRNLERQSTDVEGQACSCVYTPKHYLILGIIY